MQDQTRDPVKDTFDTLYTGVGLAQAFAMPVHAWWTRLGTAGEMYLGGRLSVLGWLMLPVWPLAVQPCDYRAMYWFWGATTLLLVCHRVRHLWLRRKGFRPHSMFMGLSRLDRLGNGLARRVLEPVLTAALGFLLMHWDRAFGLYLVWAGMALVVSTGYVNAIEASTVRQMFDARWEQEWMAERMKEG